jgi:ferredoxin
VRVEVDRSVCDLHGQCVFTAPEIFRFDDDGELEYVEQIDDRLAANAQAAASVCPTAAIELLP